MSDTENSLAQIAAMNRFLAGDHQAIADRIEAEVRPLLDLGREDGGYNCCGCGTYDMILDHALRIIHDKPAATTQPEETA